MNRLQAELHRLYLSDKPLTEGQDSVDPDCGLVDANGQVRAMVMEVARQAGWGAVGALWQGIQNDLELPAPAIAVSGVDGYQVWLSLLEPIPVAHAQDLLDLLRLRYLGDIAPRHVRMLPAAEAGAPPQTRRCRLVPALQAETGRWSAFVAPGLASMFADEPWLDVPPNPDAQANILSRLECIKPAGLRRVQNRLRPVIAEAPQTAPADQTAVGNGLTLAGQLSSYDGTDPRRFLLAVMNDPAVELRLRIEAAKALLPVSQYP